MTSTTFKEKDSNDEQGETTCKLCEHWPEEHTLHLCHSCERDRRTYARHSYRPGGQRSTQ